VNGHHSSQRVKVGMQAEAAALLAAPAACGADRLPVPAYGRCTG
jgi:hypothetical protein